MNQAVERALSCLDEAALIATLSQLVRTPSVYRPGVPGANEEAVTRLVADLLHSWGWQPNWETVVPGRPNVIADLVGAEPGRTLLFEGHSDVVTPGDLSAWTHDPFGAEIVAGRMYGRGSADMKAGLAAMLYAAWAIQASGVRFKGRIRLAVLCDEEGMMLGAKHLVAQGYAKDVDALIVCEPEEREVCIAQKGALRLRLVSHGRIAHGAMPETGVNALAGMTRLLNRLLDLQTRLQQAYGTHPYLGKPYVTPTILRAPLNGDTSQLNCLPGTCDAYLDVRSLPAFSHDQVRGWIGDEIDAVCAENPQFRFDLETLDDRPATETDPAAAIVHAVLAAHQRVYAEQALFGGVPGSTDGTILWRAHHMPLVTYGPGDKLIPHQPDEFVRVDEVIKAARVYIAAALGYFAET